VQADPLHKRLSCENEENVNHQDSEAGDKHVILGQGRRHEILLAYWLSSHLMEFDRRILIELALLYAVRVLFAYRGEESLFEGFLITETSKS